MGDLDLARLSQPLGQLEPALVCGWLLCYGGGGGNARYPIGLLKSSPKLEEKLKLVKGTATHMFQKDAKGLAMHLVTCFQMHVVRPCHDLDVPG